MSNPKKFLKKTTLLILAIISLAACSQISPQPTSTPDSGPAELFNPVISATGEVLPEQWSRLSLSTSGIIEELHVAEDDTLEAGQVILRLQGRENLEAAIANAKYEVAAAEKALADLYEEPELRIADASQAVVDARIEVRDAERYLRNLQSQAPQADIDQARANVALSRERLDEAIEDFKPYEKKPEDNLTRAALLSKKAQAEKDYDAAVRLLNNLSGTANELDIAEAESDLELAQAKLTTAERDLETLKQGPDPREVALAEERLENARVQLATAEDALDDLILYAPFAGTVSELYVHPNEWIAPGQSALLLADLNHLRVETTDLNEIDVARIKVGDTASISFDALPDLVVEGTVIRIATKADEGSGVNFPVVLELNEIPAEIRWGMTAFVDIEVDN